MLGFSKVTLIAGALAFFSIGAAQAVPTFTNSTFQSSFTPTGGYIDPSGSNMFGWTGAGLFGVAPQDNASYYNNGAGGTYVGILEGGGTNIAQTVTGFTIGNVYQVTTTANARAGFPTSGLGITVNGTYIEADPVPALQSVGLYTTPFGSFVSSTFIASSSSLLFNFINIVAGDNAVLLSSATIADLGPSVPAVPEPISAALLGAGLAFTLWTRRRATV